MGLGTNTDLQAIFGQVDGLLAKLPSGTEGGSSFNAGEFFKLGNILNGSLDLEGGSSGSNGDQTANMIKSTINTVMSLIDKITNQEAKAAREEVQRNKKAADELQKEQEKSRAELQSSIDTIQGDIETESTVVTDSTKSLEDVNKELAEKQAELNAIVQEIEEQQKLLAEAKTPKEKAAILGQIQGLSGQISELVGSLGELQSQVEELSQSVENAVTNIETAKGNAVTVQQDGQMEILKLVQEGGTLLTQNTSTQVKGVTNQGVGAGLQAAAEAASSNMFSAGAAPKLYRAANDQSTAGDTRTSGSLANLQTVLQGIGGLKDNTSLLSHFETAIGSALDAFSGAVGSWNTSVDPVITSIGSFEAVKTGNEELNAAVTSDLSSLGYTAEVDESGEVTVTKEDNGEEEEQNSDNSQVELQTSQFDVQAKLNPFEKVKVEQ